MVCLRDEATCGAHQSGEELSLGCHKERPESKHTTVT